MHSLLFPGLDLGLSSIGSGPSALLLGASGWGWSVCGIAVSGMRRSSSKFMQHSADLVARLDM